MSSPRADRVGGLKKRRGVGAGTPSSTVVRPTTMPAPASTTPPIAPPPVRRPLHARKSAFVGFPAHPSPATTAGPTVRPSMMSSPSIHRVGGVSGAAATGTSASRSAVGTAAAAVGATAVAATGATAVMPPAAPSFQAAAAAVMPAAVPPGQPSYGSMAATRYAAAAAGNAAAAAAAAAVVAMSAPAPPGQLFGAASSYSSAFQTQQLACDDMDVDPSKRERTSTATAMMASALASVLQAKLSLAGRPSMTKAEEEAMLLQAVIADADLARAQAAVEELRAAEWASNQMDVDDDEEYEGPRPMEVDG